MYIYMHIYRVNIYIYYLNANELFIARILSSNLRITFTFVSTEGDTRHKSAWHLAFAAAATAAAAVASVGEGRQGRQAGRQARYDTIRYDDKTRRPNGEKRATSDERGKTAGSD